MSCSSAWLRQYETPIPEPFSDDSPNRGSGKVLLARSDGCAHQAFRFGRWVDGLQFHLQGSRLMLAEWIKADREPTDRSSFQRALETNAGALRAQAERLIDNFMRVYASFVSP